jgi:queuine tRNA-ribosyltransferase
VNEILGLRMLSVHNSHMYLKVMQEVRKAIANGTFGDYYREFIANYRPSQKVMLARAAAKDR